MADRYEVNPFSENKPIPVSGKRVTVSRMGSNDGVVISNRHGEVLGTEVSTFKKVDSAKFVKLFAHNIALTFDLNKSGIKAFTVLMWIVQERAINKDVVVLDKLALDDFVGSCGNIELSMATFSRGIKCLEEAHILAKTMRKGWYFINPSFCFNGDRIAFTSIIERDSSL